MKKWSDELSDNKEKSIRYALSRVKSFIEINKIRYGDKINCSISCDDNLLDKKQPFAMLLPFIQSSILPKLCRKYLELQQLF